MSRKRRESAAAATSPSRTAARSRGPPRASTKRDSERARSGAAESCVRASLRAAPSAANSANRVERALIAGRIGQRRASRWPNSRAPATVTVRFDRGDQRAAALAGQLCASIRGWRASRHRSSATPPAASRVGGDSGGRAPSWVRST